jgi:hypothetical protein
MGAADAARLSGSGQRCPTVFSLHASAILYKALRLTAETQSTRRRRREDHATLYASSASTLRALS